MKMPANRDLFEYWNKRRGFRAAPERGDIEPDVIRHVLGDTFFLSADSAGNFPFRLAGTRVGALFGRDLKGESFFNLWSPADRPTVHKLLASVVDEKVGVIAQAIGRTTDGAPLSINLEMMLLPLLKRGPLDARVLGACVPVNIPYWLGTRFVGSLELGSLRHIGPSVDQVPAPRLVSGAPHAQARSNGQTRGRLVVYEGGRSD